MSRLLIVLFTALVGCSSRDAVEQYGFVALLGDDTVSVERITRTSRRLLSDDVDRFPVVRQRHTEIDLDHNGRLTRMVMDVRNSVFGTQHAPRLARSPLPLTTADRWPEGARCSAT